MNAIISMPSKLERSGQLAPTGFDYSDLSDEVASEARALADRVRDRNMAAILENGRDLIGMKEKLGHGRFLSWIDAEFGMSDRTAERYMNAARKFEGKFDTVSKLPPTALYKLAAPSTPVAIREKIVQRVDEHSATGTQREVRCPCRSDCRARQRRIHLTMQNGPTIGTGAPTASM